MTAAPTTTPWMSERRIPSPEEMQAIIRRAHAERAEVLRDAVAALLAWRQREVPQRAAPTSLKAAHCA